MAAPQSNILNSEEDDFDYISRDKTRNNKNKLISSSMDTSVFINQLHQEMPLNFDPLQMPLIDSKDLNITPIKPITLETEVLDETIREYSKIKHNIK